MSQRTISVVIRETYGKPPTKNYIINEANIYHFDETWNIDIISLGGCGLKNNRGYKYISVVIDNFSKLGSLIRMENKNVQTKTSSFEIFLKS